MAAMKRKLDQREEKEEKAADVSKKVPKKDQPTTEEPAATPATSAEAAADSKKKKEPTFAELGLDARLVQAVAAQKFATPTLVQRRVVPLALEGRDVLAAARTGSGKTLAYVLPVLSSILRRKEAAAAAKKEEEEAFTAALILVPTTELVNQVFRAVEEALAFCARAVHAVKLTDKASVQRSLLSGSPDLVVATPAKAWANASSGALALGRLAHLVLDEADLLLSYGYDEDLRGLASSAGIPRGAQTIMMSATLMEADADADLDTLKELFCRGGKPPALLDLKEPADGKKDDGLVQYVVRCGEDDKFLLIYVIFKLQLVRGKTIVYVADVDRCYRLRLFLEQFGVRSCILNPELPVNSRLHVIEEFNRGVYDIIIASDEAEIVGSRAEEEKEKKDKKKKEKKEGKRNDGEEQEGEEEEEEEEEEKEEEEKEAEEEEARQPSKKKQKKGSSRRDPEYGVSRGIDFRNAMTVINFDLPTSSSSYTHRIGRTARANQTGMALSFAVPSALYRKHAPTSVETAAHDERVLARITRHQSRLGRSLLPYAFDMSQVEGFRYRMGDALRAVTRVAVREARARDLRQELLRSERLRRHFEENPAELRQLRHDGELRTAARQQPHLRHVPEYLLPAEGRKALAPGGPQETIRKFSHKRGFKKGFGGKGGFKAGGAKKGNPLKTFRARPKGK